jgi:YtkA-like
MRVLVVLTALVGALALPALATGGGWATVGFEPLPDGTSAGGTWNPTIFVKQHGVTPLAGLQPVVTIEEDEGAATREFIASATSEAGVYEADVVFPDAGDWRVTIHSGFGDSQVTYGPVAIGAAGGAGDSQPLPYVVGVAVIALLGGLVLLGARRSRRLSPASG